MLSRALLIFILTTSKPVFILCPSWYHVPLPHPQSDQTHKLTFVHPKWIRNLNAIARRRLMADGRWLKAEG